MSIESIGVNSSSDFTVFAAEENNLEEETLLVNLSAHSNPADTLEKFRVEGEVLKAARGLNFNMTSTEAFLTSKEKAKLAEILSMPSSQERDMAICKFFDSVIVLKMAGDTKLKIINEFRGLIEKFETGEGAICFWFKLHCHEISAAPTTSPDITKRFLDKLADFDVSISFRIAVMTAFADFMDDKLKEQPFNLQIRDAAIKSFTILKDYVEELEKFLLSSAAILNLD